MIKYLNQIWVRQVCITAVLFAKVDFFMLSKKSFQCAQCTNVLINDTKYWTDFGWLNLFCYFISSLCCEVCFSSLFHTKTAIYK